MKLLDHRDQVVMHYSPTHLHVLSVDLHATSILTYAAHSFPVHITIYHVSVYIQNNSSPAQRHMLPCELSHSTCFASLLLIVYVQEPMNILSTRRHITFTSRMEYKIKVLSKCYVTLWNKWHRAQR